MAMAPQITDSIHVLSLLIQRETDIPQVRAKAKLLAKAAGCNRLTVIQIATAASESARMLLQMFGGGKVRQSLIHGTEPEDTGIELLFTGRRECGIEGDSLPACPVDRNDYLQFPALTGIKTVLDSLELKGGVDGIPLSLCCRRWGLRLDWIDLQHRIRSIRKELFRDTEESYMENLRIKHDEVLRLLREKSAQNRVLDQANSELLQLTNDLEALAEERTVVEMSLHIADKVRNPATVIGGLAGQALKKTSPESYAAGKLRKIADEATRLEQVVRGFNRLAARQHQLFVMEDLVQLLDESLEACSSLAQKGLQIERRVPAEPVLLRANGRILKVAIMHLQRYIARDTLPGSRMAVRVDRDEGSPILIFSYQSQGRQIEMDSRKSGLMLVRQILAEHHGTLEIQNGSAPDDETNAIIRFPLVWHEQDDNPFSPGGS